MGFLNEMEIIRDIKRVDGDIVVNKIHKVPINELKFRIDGDAGGMHVLFENHGAQTIWGITWRNIEDFLEGHSIDLPEDIKPCHNCTPQSILCPFGIGCKKYQ